jgi:teichuronic acid biosynthesis glycosyltransferase TuaG
VHSNNEIKISVIIPVYNGAETIAQSIDCVLAQSYPPHEIIVVDDASKDNTAEVIQSKYEGKIQFIQKLTNQGSAGARNKGMDAATGDYIAFLDSGDVWHNDKLMLLSTLLSSQPAIKIFYDTYTYEQIANKPLPENIVVYKLPFVKLLSGNVILPSSLVMENNKAFRFATDMPYMSSYDLCLKVGYKRKIYFIKIPVTQIRRQQNKSKWDMCKGEMKAYTRLLRLNPLFAGLLPFLLLSSIVKAIASKI